MSAICFVTLDRDESRGVPVICRQCGAPLEQTSASRPRLYCSAACRQRAHRRRARGAAVTRDQGDLTAVTTQLRDIADRLWLHSLGWRPSMEESADDTDLAQLIADAGQLVGRIADLNGARAPDSTPVTKDVTKPTTANTRSGD